MITRQKQLWYFVGDQAFKSLEEAQKADLIKLMPSDWPAPVTTDKMNEFLSEWILTNSAAILDCLTTTPKSRLRGRKIYGAQRKPRTPKTAPEAIAAPKTAS